MRYAVAALALTALVSQGGSARAQTSASPLSSGTVGSIRKTSNDLVDRLDIIWVEHGRVVFSYGNGKIFGIDIRDAMGNPAALRSTTEVKWDNFLADFNSRVVLLAAQYPPQVFPDGAAVDPHVVFQGLGDTFNQMATEEQIDLFGYALRTTAMGGASEEETMNAFAWAGYLGGAAGAAYMMSTNNVTLPVTFKLFNGRFRAHPYDVRFRVRWDELGFGSKHRHPDLSTRTSLRILNFSEASVDLGWKDFLWGAHPAKIFERATYDLRRYGTYYVGAEQDWNPVRTQTDFQYLVGAQADIITPGRWADSRLRTGVEYSIKNSNRLPDRYLLDLYHRQTVFKGSRDFTIQARGSLLVDNFTFQGVGGEIRGSYLIGSNVPKYSSAYSKQDWDRFSRVYMLVQADTRNRQKNAWSARVVYAAPFEIDRAVEMLYSRLREGEPLLSILANPVGN
jgi:hypothetical protein